MSHNLFGDRFLGYREPAWHHLGSVFTEPLTAVEAAERSGVAQIVVEKRPLLVDLGGVSTTIDRVAIVRQPTADDPQYRVFGDCAKNYGIIQNAVLAEHLDELTGKWPVETMGALGYGETVFMTLDAGEREIKGDHIKQYFLLTDTKDGKTGIRMHFTPVRVVCENTLIVGEGSAVASARLRHDENVEAELKWRLDLIKQLQDLAERVMLSFDLMASAQLEDEQMVEILEAAYPYPRKPAKVQLSENMTPEQAAKVEGLMDRVNQAEREWMNARQRQDERRGAAQELYGKFNDEYPDVARTPWAAYNAVCECEDWREGVGKEEVELSLLFGLRARAKHRAYDAALEYVEVARQPEQT